MSIADAVNVVRDCYSTLQDVMYSGVIQQNVPRVSYVTSATMRLVSPTLVRRCEQEEYRTNAIMFHDYHYIRHFGYIETSYRVQYFEF